MKFEVLMGRIFIAILTALIVLFSAEIVARRFLPLRSPVEQQLPPQLIRKPFPYIMFKGSPGVRITPFEFLNENGYRGPAPSREKKPGAFRIFILGGSTVFNGAPTFAALLEEKFKQNGFPQVEVYNYGVVSSVSGMELARILFEISDLGPDLIVMYGGGNDLTQPDYSDPRPGYPYNFLVYETNPLLDSDISRYPWADLVLYGSHLARYYLSGYFVKKFIPFEKLKNESGWRSEAWQKQIAEIYVANLVKADTLSRAHGAKLIAFFQPLLYFKEPMHADETKIMKPKKIQLFNDMREKVRGELARAKEKNGLQVIDLSDFFDGRPERIFIDPIHIIQEVFAPLAERLYADLLPYVSAPVANV